MRGQSFFPSDSVTHLVISDKNIIKLFFLSSSSTFFLFLSLSLSLSHTHTSQQAHFKKKYYRLTFYPTHPKHTTLQTKSYTHTFTYTHKHTLSLFLSLTHTHLRAHIDTHIHKLVAHRSQSLAPSVSS